MAESTKTNCFRVESTGKFGNSTLVCDSDEEFNRGVALPSVAQNNSIRITENSVTRIRQEGLGVWRAIVRRCDQRNMSENNSALQH